MGIKLTDLALDDQQTLTSLKGQIEANRHGHDLYVAARDAGDDAEMNSHKSSFDAFEHYAAEYRGEADRLGVTEEPEVPVALTSPGERDIGKVPKKADAQGPEAES